MRAEATAVLRFEILGPLSAVRDGEPLRLGGSRQRALLALLLVHADEIVSTDQIVEQLFGPEHSEGAPNAVHVAISRLRRALGEDGQLLRTCRGGYKLELEPEQLDAARFERLLDEGRELLARGEPGAALERLREGLDLWHGPPLADLMPVDCLRLEESRLEELRLLAEMERIDAELALGRDRELVAEIKALIASAPLQERLRAQLMLTLYRSGRQAEALAAYREASDLLRGELGLAPSRRLQELERMILRQDAALEERDGRESSPVPCPFKGLAPFEATDADFFCGRERLVSELIARLAEWPLVGILGPSGIGKSSLLRAGVLPALRAGALPGSGRWRPILIRPGRHPHDELQRALGGDLKDAVAALAPGERIVIAVDQLEELFTACDRDAERWAFLEQLVAATNDHERRVVVVCALRADFYGRLGSYRDFAEFLSRSHVLVGPMDREGLREVIERPAARAGLEVEPQLVDALLGEVVDEPGGLPLLSTTLLELWQQSNGRVLRFDDYRAKGGVSGAVARIAETAFMHLSQRERNLARSVLLRLTDGDEGSPTRRSVPLPELERINGGPRVLKALTDARLLTVGAGMVELSHEAILREWPRYRAWLEEDRVGRRLHAHLTAAAGEWEARGRDPGDLYRGARLAAALDWCAQRRDDLDRLERAFLAASQFEADRAARRQRSQNRRLRALLVGTGVLLLIAILAGIGALVGEHQASTDARLAAAEARAAQGRQLGAEAMSEPRLDAAELLAREAVALDRSPQTEGTLLQTLLRSPAVVGTFPLPTSSTPQVAVSPDGKTLAVSDSGAHQVRFYDVRTRRRLGGTPTDFYGDQPAVYSSDASLLVYPAGGFLAVRDAHSLALRTRLPLGSSFTHEVTSDISQGSILIAPDRRAAFYGYWLMNAAGQPTTAYLDRWSLPSGRRLPALQIGQGPLLGMRLVDRATRLMMVTPHEIRTYDARTLKLVRLVSIAAGQVPPSTAAISPNGRSIAIGSKSGSVSFVNAADGASRRGLRGHGGGVADVLYAPDGKRAVSVGDDKVIVWDPKRATDVAELPGPAGHVQGAQVSPDGTTLYTAALGGELLAWDLTGKRGFGRSARLGAARPCCDPLAPHAPPLAVSGDGSRFAVPIRTSTVGIFSTATLRRLATFTITPRSDSITALAWSPAGPTLAVGAHGGLVQLWRVSDTPRFVRSLPGFEPAIGMREATQSLAFSPDGALLAATAKNQTRSIGRTFAVPFGTMAIWRAATGQLIAEPNDLGTGNGLAGSDAVAFSRDGKLLAATLLAGGVRVFDPATGRVLRELTAPGDESVSLAFAQGRTVAAGTLGGTVDTWNAATGRRLAAPLLAASASITAMAFDSDGHRLATAGYQNGTLKLWFTTTLQQEGPQLGLDPATTSTVAFAPASGELLAADSDGKVFTWPASLGAWEQRACSLAGRNLTRAEWRQYVASPGYTTVCRQAVSGRRTEAR
ncbi:MAG: nSTAND1 domain-containing NTPase [Solirubrobacteraceae bacterium]